MRGTSVSSLLLDRRERQTRWYGTEGRRFFPWNSWISGFNIFVLSLAAISHFNLRRRRDISRHRRRLCFVVIVFFVVDPTLFARFARFCYIDEYPIQRSLSRISRPRPLPSFFLPLLFGCSVFFSFFSFLLNSFLLFTQTVNSITSVVTALNWSNQKELYRIVLVALF